MSDMPDTNELVGRLTGFANGTFQYKVYRGKAPDGVPQLRSDILALVAAREAQAAELAAVKEMYAREGAKALYELERAERAEEAFEIANKMRLEATKQAVEAQQRYVEAVPVAWALMSKTAGVLSVTVERAVADKWSAQSTLSNFTVAPLFLCEGAVTQPDVDYEVWQDGCMMASCSSLPNAKRYAAVYSQDGPVEIVEAATFRRPLPTPPVNQSEGADRDAQ